MTRTRNSPKKPSKHPLRIGIYGGSFNPVHAGHITFALQALQSAELDWLYFMPERRPRHRDQVEHFAHRVAMIKRAIRPHARLGILELVDVSFSVGRTLPKLQHQFPNAELVFLMGSDTVQGLSVWPNYEQLLAAAELVVGVRAEHQVSEVQELITRWPSQPQALTIFRSYAPDVSASQVREGLRRRQPVRGLLQSVARYSNRHWLYISLS